jgi:hypothetical protein
VGRIYFTFDIAVVVLLFFFVNHQSPRCFISFALATTR